MGEFESRIGLTAVSTEPASDPLSPTPPPPLKVNKHLKKQIFHLLYTALSVP